MPDERSFDYKFDQNSFGQRHAKPTGSAVKNITTRGIQPFPSKKGGSSPVNSYYVKPKPQTHSQRQTMKNSLVK